MNRIKRLGRMFAVIVVLAAVSACVKAIDRPVESGDVQSPFASFRDIPGVTAEEIAAIEALQQRYESLSYGMTLSTEAFVTADGIGGYAALFCEWLTGLFGIPFQPAVYEWSDLVEKLNAGAIDFAGNITPTAERQKIYLLTDPVADRQFKTIQLAGSFPLDRIALTRPLRYVFIEGSAIADTVESVTENGTYEALFVSDYSAAYRALERGVADAFIGDSAVVSAFDVYGNIYTTDFLPLIFSPVSMATVKTEFEPMVNVITKALQNGARSWLNQLYHQGYESYKKNRFFTQLSDEEKAYLRDTPFVPLAARYFNYPVDFYNTHEKKWEGIIFDVLAEVEELTGLKFVVANTTRTELSDLFNMVYDGRAHIMSELIYSERRAQYVIWTKHIFLEDKLALLSTAAYPNVSAHEIPYKRVGVIANTVRAEMFRRWFPGAIHVIEYATEEGAARALEQNEVDLVMSSKNRLLSFLNFHEISLFKVNYLFNYPYESTFGFHKDQTVLCSIMDKALPLVDTHMITEQWLTKTYDYRTRLMEAQRPWLIGAIVLSLAVLILILVLFFITHGEGKRLEVLVQKRTAEINEQRKLLEYMSLTDQLTGLPNRRNFDMRLDIEWRIAIREKEAISFLMLDIDHFKKYNDNYGHQQGDEVLRMIAKTIEQTLKRPGDFAARWGGEEFAVLLSNTDARGAEKVAESIRVNIENMNVPLANGVVVKVTVSIGVNAQTPGYGSPLDDFVSVADKELYRAKGAGRNRVCCALR